MEPLITLRGLQGILVSVYLDDMFAMASSCAH